MSPTEKPTAESKTLLFSLQSFLIDTIAAVRADLPDDVEIISGGRTLFLAERGGTEFKVRVSMSQFEDDMWPHVDAIMGALLKMTR